MIKQCLETEYNLRTFQPKFLEQEIPAFTITEAYVTASELHSILFSLKMDRPVRGQPRGAQRGALHRIAPGELVEKTRVAILSSLRQTRTFEEHYVLMEEKFVQPLCVIIDKSLHYCWNQLDEILGGHARIFFDKFKAKSLTSILCHRYENVEK